MKKITIILLILLSITMNAQEGLITSYSRIEMSTYDVVEGGKAIKALKIAKYHIKFFINQEVAVYENNQLIYAFKILEVIKERSHTVYKVLNETKYHLMTEPEKLMAHVDGNLTKEGLLFIFNDKLDIQYQDADLALVFK